MMDSLKELAKTNAAWSLTEFVDIVNGLLPRYLPTVKGNYRVREEINPRLVRHYSSQGLIDEPHRQGKYAVYTYRHLLQLLVVRRLQNEGIAANAIAQLVTEKTNTELENLLSGGVQLNIAPANPALSFLEKLKNRDDDDIDLNSITADLQPNLEESVSEQPLAARQRGETSEWIRLEIAPGLEIHIKSDFKPPKTPSERKTFEQLIAQKLTKIFSQQE